MWLLSVSGLLACFGQKEASTKRTYDVEQPVVASDENEQGKQNEIKSPEEAQKTDAAEPPSLEETIASENSTTPEQKPIDITINQWPLPNEEERKKLTLEYLHAHSETHPFTGDLETDVRMKPRVIVLHWTAGPSAESTHRYFSSATLNGRKKLQGAGAVNVGSQFLIDRDGTIHQLLEETRIARHCIGLNHISIGVENVGGGKQWPLTEEQVEANILLIRYLNQKHDITHVIGHFEYRKLEGHPYFSEKDPKYRTAKSDPGADFMTKVRAGIEDLELLGVE